MRLCLLLAGMACWSSACSRPYVELAGHRQDGFVQGKVATGSQEDPTLVRRAVSVAILPLANRGYHAPSDQTGALLAESITAALLGRGDFSIVERDRLEAVLSELQMHDGALVDDKTAVRIGGLLGANVIALGSYSKIDSDNVVTLRLIGVESAEVLGAASVAGPDLREASKRAAEKLVSPLVHAPRRP